MDLDSYWQNNPNSLVPFTPDSRYSDPTFSECFTPTCYKTVGLRLFNTTYFFNYGAGLYSFFNNYDQGCLLTESCDEHIVKVEQSEGIYLYALNTKASFYMVEIDDVGLVPQSANRNGFCSTAAIFEYP